MIGLEELLARLEEQMARLETLDDATRADVVELLDGVDLLHRYALYRMAQAIGRDTVGRVAAEEPFVAWLDEAYGLVTDERAAAVDALAQVRPFLHSHGGDVEVLGASAGIVHVRLTGACQGCTAASITLQQGVEEALREHLPGFVVLEIEPDVAAPHPPPGPTLDAVGIALGRPLPLHPS